MQPFGRLARAMGLMLVAFGLPMPLYHGPLGKCGNFEPRLGERVSWRTYSGLPGDSLGH